MSGVLGNDNLAWDKGSQFLTIDGTSDTISCPTDTQAVSLFSDVACWVTFGSVPVAAAPGAEKTQATSFYLPASVLVDYPIPQGTDAVPTKVAAIQADGAGTLYVNFRGF
jgi:hypothetical protein